jgi:hypothetical protein
MSPYKIILVYKVLFLSILDFYVNVTLITLRECNDTLKM